MLVRPVPVDHRSGPATAATHRCVWGALAAAVAYPALSVSGTRHAEVVAAGVGLLTVLPWVGPALGILLAGVASTITLPIMGVLTMVGVGLVGVPAQHLPRWLGPLSPAAAGASVLFGGALAGLLGAVGALLLAATAAPLARRARSPRRDEPRPPAHPRP